VEPAANTDDPAKALEQGPPKATHKGKIKGGKRRERSLDRLRLRGSAPLYIAFVIFSFHPPFAEEHIAITILRLFGLVIALAGVAVRTWSLGYLLKKAELATAGPYGRTRNPLYVGTWLIGCGLALLAAWPFNLVLLLVFSVFTYVIYRRVIAIEEEVLESIFGNVYDEYRNNVPVFFPSIKAWRIGAVSRFSLGRAMHNRAWEPMLGVALLLILQVAAWGLIWPMIKGGAAGEVWRAFIGGGWLGI
jgi:protein-S-isoprenylcysteine O-methyltransferase Ste14